MNINPTREFPMETLAAFGSLQIAFSQLEESIKALLGKLLLSWDPGAGQVVTSQLSIRESLALLGELYKRRTKNPELIRDLKALTTEVNKIIQMRNDFTHAALRWSPSASAGIRLRYRVGKQKGQQRASALITAAEIEALVKRISVVSNETSFGLEAGIKVLLTRPPGGAWQV